MWGVPLPDADDRVPEAEEDLESISSLSTVMWEDVMRETSDLLAMAENESTPDLAALLVPSGSGFDEVPDGRGNVVPLPDELLEDFPSDEDDTSFIEEFRDPSGDPDFSEG
ncbi:PREDICTED: uncharacterized protein LOC105460157, partial [Wasmannia auropunctata]|uniref:uncharacterized protein LOC105460157 n=1 Tax=Wasmannia auropunctata TaxID=64793 RepID=UPI0005EFB34A